MIHYKWLAATVIIVILVTRFYYQVKCTLSNKIIIKNTKHVREWTIVLFTVSTYSVPAFLWLFTNWIEFAHFSVTQYWRWIGFFVGIISAFGYGWVHHVLGENWSPVLEIRNGHQLITHGPFQFVRHPMYASIWLGVIGMNLLVGNYLLLLPSVVSTLILCLVRIPDEEKLMIEQFGDQYQAYMLKVNRLVPFW